ncbi:site-2 protease family protein [Desulfobulbus sp. F4]|nr:site-2 protease family protein [Desulfobulbus sp. F4]
MDIRHYVINFLIIAPPFLFALTMHELAHGWTAWKLGDPTAKNEGRLTMNPLKHLDPMGAVLFLLANIGWAKPVPVNPAYFRNPNKGMLLVALAGPGANVLIAVVSAVLFRLLIETRMVSPFLLSLLQPAFHMLIASVWINVMLAVFNILPIPPLDGSKVLMSILPRDTARSYAQIEPYSFILLLLLSYLGVISMVILPVIQFANELLLG